MQSCWSACQPDASVDNSTCQQILTPCEFCFEPSNPVIMTEIFSVTRERQCSEPVPVPDTLAAALINSHQQPKQSHSSGYESTYCESTYGNELSPTTNSWTLG
jgi:hypothetical protein